MHLQVGLLDLSVYAIDPTAEQARIAFVLDGYDGVVARIAVMHVCMIGALSRSRNLGLGV